jgi:1-acyl-sn-glycerol-3-phosphate acyltransferase
MLRTLYVAVVAFFATLALAPPVFLVAPWSRNSRVVEWCVRRWAKFIRDAAGIDLRNENLDRIDPKQRYVIVANHHSYFDIPCLFGTMAQPLRFFAKISLFKIPIFGWGMKAAGFIPIDRKNRSGAKASFDLAASRIKRGNSIVIFPEEGRSHERTMKPFQRGAFLLAIRSELPIVPVAIDGTYDVMPATRWAVHPGPVTVRVGNPIETKGLGVRAKDELMGRVRGEIEKMLEKQ